MPLLSSVILAYIPSLLCSLLLVLTEGEVCNSRSMDKQAAHLNPNVCVHSFPGHRVLSVLSSITRPFSVSEKLMKEQIHSSKQ